MRVPLLLGLVMTGAIHAQLIRADTRALVASLEKIRGQESGYGKGQFPAMRTAFLAWVDTRLGARHQIEPLNKELRAAHLSGFGRGEFWGTDNTGLLSISAIDVFGAADLFAVKLGVGVAIGYDETIVLYQRTPWQRLGWISQDVTTGEYMQFSSITGGLKDADGKRLIASGAYPIMRRYNGPMAVKFRVDVLEGSAMKTILNKEVMAEYDWQHDKVEEQFVASTVEGNVATFLFWRPMRTVDLSRGMFRYSVSGSTLTRIPPLAITKGGFIDEWLRLEPDEAARMSAPEAAEGHRAMNDFLRLHKDDDHFYFDKISMCGDNWEVIASTFFNAPTSKWVFLFSGSNATDLRMLSVGSEPHEGCVKKDDAELTNPLPEA